MVMHRFPLFFRILASCALIAYIPSTMLHGETEAERDFFEEALDEADASEDELLHWQLEDEALLDQVDAAGSRWALMSELSALLGWTDNVLRAPEATSSLYGGLQSEVFVWGQPSAKSRFQAFVFAELRQYAADLDDDRETLLMSQLKWTQEVNDWELIASGDAFYGDQILEAIEQPGGETPVSERIRQTYGAAEVAVGRTLSARHRVEGGVGVAKYGYDNSIQDFRQGSARVEWTWMALDNLRIRSGYRFARESFSDMPAREASGLILPQTVLRLNRHEVSLQSRWSPAAIRTLSFRLGVRHEWIQDPRGDYDSREQSRLQPSLTWQPDNWRFTLGTDIWRVRYTDRQVSFTNTATTFQDRNAGFINVRRYFTEYAALNLRYDYTRLRSPRDREAYRRHSVESSFVLSF